MIDIKEIKATLILIGFGVTVTYLGLTQLKIRRKMKNTPKSKIASAAVGSFVEVQGKVYGEENDLITSPLTNKRGINFIWELEWLNPKERNWLHLHSFHANPHLFLKDTSEGLAGIDLSYASKDIPYDHITEFNSYSFDLPTKVKRLLFPGKKINQRLSLIYVRYRLMEKMFIPGETLYAIGAVKIRPMKLRILEKFQLSGFVSEESMNRKVMTEYNSKLKDSAHVAQFDLDQNGILDGSERELLYKNIEERITRKYQKTNQKEYLKKTKIFFTNSSSEDADFHFILSKQLKSDLSSDYQSRGIKLILIGSILLISGIYWFFQVMKLQGIK